MVAEQVSNLTAQRKRRIDRPAFVLVGGLIGCGFLVPTTLLGMVFGAGAALLLAATVLLDRPRLSAWFIGGVVLSIIGFYWLPATLQRFGGFPAVPALILFALFCATSALQLVLVGFLTRALERVRLVDRALLALPLAWFAAEYSLPRLFPWSLSHLQIPWSAFAALAELGRTELLSALLLWWCSIVVALLTRRRGVIIPAALGATSAAALLTWGDARNGEIARLVDGAPTVTVGLIQGNLDTDEKGDVTRLDANLFRYQELSDTATEQGASLLLWPESVISRWVPQRLTTLRNTPNDPYPAQRVPLLFGGLSYRQRTQQELDELLAGMYGTPDSALLRALGYYRFNTAFGIDAAGTILGLYHKRVLMPFGEYLPFGRIFPQLRGLSPHSGDFDPGDVHTPITFPQLRVAPPGGGATTAAVNVMPLICYEDLVPGLAAEAVKAGAQLLVNLTNDAWYGRTAAPYQHHLLAQWRAIETRRPLLRATNTGLTAVVDPLGRTSATLPIFTAGYLLAEVPLLDVKTVYVRWGDAPLSALALLVYVLAIGGLLSAKKLRAT